MNLHLIYGPNNYLATETVHSLRAGHQFEHIYDAASLDSVYEQVSQQGLFGDPPIIILIDLLKKLPDGWLENYPGNTVIIWEKSAIDKRKKITKWLLQHAQVHECKDYDQRGMNGWVKKKGFLVDYAMLKVLWDRYGSNMWAWENELEKISLSLPEGATVTDAYIDLLSEPTVEENIFLLTDMFGQRDAIESLRQYHKLVQQRTDVYYLFTMLLRHIRLLLLAGEEEGLKGQHPFVVKKMKQQRTRWSQDELLDRHALFVTLDSEVKKGLLAMEDGLVEIILR